MNLMGTLGSLSSKTALLNSSNQICIFVIVGFIFSLFLGYTLIYAKGVPKVILLLPGFLAEQQESPRVQGYRRSLEKHGIDFRQEYILQRSGIRSSEEETGELIRSLFASGLTADGLITSSDRAAFGAVRALQSIGYFVPEDVRLISFDNSSYSAMASPSVSSLDRKTDRLAAKACEILCRLMAGEKDVPMENIIEVTLQQRDSSR